MLPQLSDGYLMTPRTELSVPYVVHNTPVDESSLYERRNELGRGAVGVVFLALLPCGRYVAVKRVMRAGLNVTQVERVRSEFRRMDRCRHPNVVELLMVHEDPEKILLVMELSDIGDLWRFTTRRLVPLDTISVARIFIDVLAALRRMHELGLVHRDIKPENILLRSPSTGTIGAFIADFGLTTHIRSEPTVGTPCGTLQYAAPELLRQRPFRGPEIDVWSLGVVLYFMLFSELPFTGEVQQEVVEAICFYPVPLSGRSSLVPESAISLLKRMLTKDRAKRITVEEIIEHDFVTQFLSRSVSVRDFSEPNPSEYRRFSSSPSPIFEVFITVGASCLLLQTAEHILSAAVIKQKVREALSVRVRLFTDDGSGSLHSFKGPVPPGRLHLVGIIQPSHAASRATRSMYEAMNLLPTPCYITNSSGVVCFANRAFAQLADRPVADCIGCNLASFYRDPIPDLLLGYGGSRRRSRKPAQPIQATLIRTSGSPAAAIETSPQPNAPIGLTPSAPSSQVMVEITPTDLRLHGEAQLTMHSVRSIDALDITVSSLARRLSLPEFIYGRAPASRQRSRELVSSDSSFASASRATSSDDDDAWSVVGDAETKVPQDLLLFDSNLKIVQISPDLCAHFRRPYSDLIHQPLGCLLSMGTVQLLQRLIFPSQSPEGHVSPPGYGSDGPSIRKDSNGAICASANDNGDSTVSHLAGSQLSPDSGASYQGDHSPGSLSPCCENGAGSPPPLDSPDLATPMTEAASLRMSAQRTRSSSSPRRTGLAGQPTEYLLAPREVILLAVSGEHSTFHPCMLAAMPTCFRGQVYALQLLPRYHDEDYVQLFHRYALQPGLLGARSFALVLSPAGIIWDAARTDLIGFRRVDLVDKSLDTVMTPPHADRVRRRVADLDAERQRMRADAASGVVSDSSAPVVFLSSGGEPRHGHTSIHVHYFPDSGDACVLLLCVVDEVNTEAAKERMARLPPAAVPLLDLQTIGR